MQVLRRLVCQQQRHDEYRVHHCELDIRQMKASKIKRTGHFNTIGIVNREEGPRVKFVDAGLHGMQTEKKY